MTAAPPPIPLTVLTGPSGAGKTSLLNLALARPGMSGTLVVQNGPGRAALDADCAILADTATDALAACLCCGPRDDLARLFEDMLRRRDNNRIAPFARLVFETSGDGEPNRIVAAICAHPYLSRRYAIAGIVAVLDGSDAPGRLAHRGPAMAQIEAADRIVLSGRPADEAAFARARAAVAGVNDAAPMLDWREAAADPARLFAPDLHDPLRRSQAARRAVYRHAFGGARDADARRSP